MPPTRRTRCATARTDLVERPPPTSGTPGQITLDLRALTASISTAVSQAVKEAIEANGCATPPSAAPVAADETVNSAVQAGTADLVNAGTGNVVSDSLPVMANAVDEPHTPIFSSAAILLGSQVSDKLKAKIWSNEFIHFGSLLQSNVQHERYSLTMASNDIRNGGQPQLTLEPCQQAKKITSLNQWLSAFNTFVAIYTEKFSGQAGSLMKYCETIRDIANKPGDFEAISPR